MAAAHGRVTHPAQVGVAEVEYRVEFLRSEAVNRREGPPRTRYRVWTEWCYRDAVDARQAAKLAVETGEAPSDRQPPTRIVRAVVTEATVVDVFGEGPR